MFSLLALDENYDEWKTIPNRHYDPIGFAKWAVLLPIRVSYYYTIPDCRNPK